MKSLMKTLAAGLALSLPAELENGVRAEPAGVLRIEPTPHDCFAKILTHAEGSVNGTPRDSSSKLGMLGYGKMGVKNIDIRDSKESSQAVLTITPNSQHPALPDPSVMTGLGVRIKNLKSVDIQIEPIQINPPPKLSKISDKNDGPSHPIPETVLVELEVKVGEKIHATSTWIQSNIRRIILTEKSIQIHGEGESDSVDVPLPASLEKIESVHIRTKYSK